MSSRIRIVFFVLAFLSISFVSGNQLQEKIDVELVQVDLIATDSKGTLVTDLTAEDFVIKENGVIQKITHFYNSADEDTRYPLAVSFLVDTSYSMHETVAGLTRIQIAIQAAELAMNQLIEEDQIELIEFNEKPNVLVPFTSDLNLLRQKIQTLDFQEANTAMHDTVKYSVERIKDRSGRKIIVIFSDGMDSASKSVEEDVVEAIKRADATIIAFYSEFARLNLPAAMGGRANSMGRVRIRAGEDALRLYAEMTGGAFFSFKKEAELLKAMDALRAYIKNQYTLAYKPAGKKQKAGYRKIKVECNRKGIELRHREGYWAG